MFLEFIVTIVTILVIAVVCLIIVVYKINIKVNKMDILVNYIYVRKIYKKILISLFTKYQDTKCIKVFKINNYFYFNFISQNNILSEEKVTKLNYFKEKYYQLYYQKINNYIHLNNEKVNEKIDFNDKFNYDDNSTMMLKKSIDLLLEKKYINLDEKNLLLDELYLKDFNIFKNGEEFQKLLKGYYYNKKNK